MLYYPSTTAVLSVLFRGEVKTSTIQAVPREVNWTRNTARKADTARLTLDYRDFPIDPRIVEDIVLEVHGGNVTFPGEPIVPGPDNLRFIGLVDEPETTWDDADRKVTFRARDYTGVWLDFKWPSDRKIETPKGVTLGDIVLDLFETVTPNLNGPVYTDDATQDLQPFAVTGRKVFTPDKDASNAWDLLCAICELFGLVPVFDLDTLVIRTPAEVRGGTVAMMWGSNVSRLMFRRNLKQPARKQVVVKAWNPVAARVLEARHPSDAEAGVTRLTGANNKPSTTINRVQYNVEGPYDQAQLDRLAAIVYAELAQQQLTGEIETRELTDLDGADLMSLANGDRLRLTLDTSDQLEIATMPASQAVEYLTDRARPGAMTREVAETLIAARDGLTGLAARAGQAGQVAVRAGQVGGGDEWYVLEADHTWSEDGYHVRIGFTEFVL